ncbi:MAG: hypothetical protein PWQ81_198 [Bacteroidota bacterium]|jgi:uncharacterized membrane protein SirB2|nr:hypothetical protein [Methermicoccus sp.]MDI3504976.1 hypothetical protein [Bacteroidota bacterium]MDK2837635.1 hypothetical protein [Bacteroidota bacterium]MDN5296928.1 hypothetical protein [Bacteroidota bacterium]
MKKNDVILLLGISFICFLILYFNFLFSFLDEKWVFYIFNCGIIIYIILGIQIVRYKLKDKNK